jgi:hypothetical protein
MSSINAVDDVSIGLRERVERSVWIVSPSFDILLLIFAPVVTLPIIAGIYFRIPIIALGVVLTLQFAHYASTATFYFWKENKDYLRERWFAFFAVPGLIAMVCLLIVGFDVPYILQVIIFVWNTFHVARQNHGILSIYRARAGVKSSDQKTAAHNAIVAVSAFLAVWNIDTHKEVMGFFGWFSNDLSWMVKVVAFVIAGYFVARLILALFRRNEPIGLPEGLFLLSSLGFFWPYLLIRDSMIATIAMLLPHYVQYMALVWLLHRRKFGGPALTGGDAVPAPLRLISGNLTALVLVLLAIGWSCYILREYSMTVDHEAYVAVPFLLVAILHFYLDGIIWSFRRPHVRQTILPALLQGPASSSR